MKAVYICILLASLAAAAATAGEPEKLVEVRNVYLKHLQEIEAERNQKVRKLTEQYVRKLDQVKTDYTKAGDLDGALAVRKEIDEFAPFLKPVDDFEAPKPVSVEVKPVEDELADKVKEGVVRPKVKKVVLYNVNVPRKGHEAYVDEGTVSFYNGETQLVIHPFKLAHNNEGKKTKAVVELKTSMNVTRIKVECRNTTHPKGVVSLDEIQVIDWRGRNVAPAAKLTSSPTDVAGSGDKRDAARLVDGETESYLTGGHPWQLTNGVRKGWAQFDW